MSTTQERLDRQLLNACRYGHVSEVDILLSKGANIHYSDEDDPFGATCLSEASRRGKSEIVQLLITRGVSVNDKISHDITSLHLACERGHIPVVRVLLKNNCDPCPQELFNLDTPLHYAAANDHDNICKLLVETGNVNVNIINRTGDTPLHIAVANDRLTSTTMLLQLGGDLNITNHAEMTPIIVAQLAKCKHATEAMRPFIDKIKKEVENEQKIKQEKLVQSRKNTIKKTLDLTGNQQHKNSAFAMNNNNENNNEIPLDEENKYDDIQYNDYYNNKNRSLPDSLMSGKRDVVFKKGFLQKQGKKFKHFHERYFILWSNGLMNYYSKEHTIFANYAEKSKETGNKNRNSSGDNAANNAANNKNKNNLNIQMPENGYLEQQKSTSLSPSPDVKKSSTSKCDDDAAMAFEDISGDEMPEKEEEISNKKEKKRKRNVKGRKRRSTLHKLGLKSDVIKPKGIIDINDLIETQFLEFASDNSPGWALITAEREWKFKCKSDRERREWIAAVHAVNYGISPFDFMNLNMNISYEHNTMLLTPNNNSFVSKGVNKDGKGGVNGNDNKLRTDAVAQGWMYKLGAAVRGLEQNYWKKRWVSLYKKPPRLAYSLHPYTVNDLSDLDKINDIKGLKGVIQLNDVTNIIKIGNNDIIKNKYRAPTVHVFALITEKRTWVFSCKTAEECGMWYDRISFFLPNQWKQESKDVNVEELLRFNRVKTVANEAEAREDEKTNNNNHLNVNGKKKKNNKNLADDTVMSKIFRKVSNVAETLGITEQYSTISVPATVACKYGYNKLKPHYDKYMKYKHDWMPVKEPGAPSHVDKSIDNKTELKHEQEDEKKIQQVYGNETDDGSDDKLGILVVGNTGTGKSSLIQLLSGQQTKISHTTERGNDTTSTVPSIYDNNLFFIDTIGLADSNVSWTDPNLLKNILKYMHYGGFYKIKIIFCVEGGTDLRKGLFGQIAKFIGKLKVDQNEAFNPTDEPFVDDEKIFTNIWNSVLIIKKKPTRPEDLDDFKGIFKCAQDNGASEQFNSKEHIFGFTCTDWNFDKTKYPWFQYLNTKHHRQESAFFTESEAKEIISSKLNKLPVFELKFGHEACTKCGAMGDSRYITAGCHTHDEYYHDQPLDSKHAGSQIYRHKGKLEYFAFVKDRTRHPGQRISNHSGRANVRYHPGTLQTASVKRVGAFILTLSLSEWLIWESEEWHWYDCCNTYVGNAGDGCALKWSCCNVKASNNQCTNPWNKRWTCCNKGWISQGCEDVVEAEKLYTCCRKNEAEQGCCVVYSCCGLDGSGCEDFYPCCDRGKNSTGCKQKCVNCKLIWGTGPGCVKAT